jgi:predicted nucleic acid-binding protein
MAHLVDTSVLARLANAGDPFHAVAAHAVVELHRQGEILHVAPQNFIEFRSVAMREKSMNGLGLSTADAEQKATAFEAIFPLLTETPDIYVAWKALVGGLGIVGKQVHDARLVAVCHVHRVTHLLTFNVGHFARMAGFGPGIEAVDPVTVQGNI